MFKAINSAQLRTSPLYTLLAFALLATTPLSSPASVNAAPIVRPDKMTRAQTGVEETGRTTDRTPIAGANTRLSSEKTVSSTSAVEKTTYIVVLKDESLARYSGGVSGYPATSAQAKGAHKLSVRAPESVRYLSYLDRQRAVAIESAKNVIGRHLDVSYEYGATIVGFAAEMTAKEAQRISDLDQVAFVEIEKISTLHTDAGPAWSGVTDIWNGATSTFGEGVIVGIIDTGIDPWNPSFLGTGGDGYVHTNPLGDGNYLGVCNPSDPTYDPTFPCNEKLIGARAYPTVNGGDARDYDGHGSHTGSTAAGNFVIDAEVAAPTGAFSANISGMAPHANIIAYNACCSGAALTAARDQALLDGVDVINYSIGSSAPTGNYWQDSESIQWLALRDAGVFVATSNGNNGNGDATTGSPADVPWITSAGANSHYRAFLVNLELTDSNAVSITVSGQALATGYGPAEVVFSNSVIDTEDARLCAPGAFAPGTFNGQIVICERGVYGRVAKGQSVLDGGAGGLVLAQPNEGDGGPGAVSTDSHVLPAVHIDYYEYQKLRQFLLVDAVGAVSGDLSGAAIDLNASHGDIMGSFSSRGPNGTDADLIVPSVTAPGRAILAAYHQGVAGDGDYTFNILQGTSMSSPHVAGAAALLTVLHPDWTPAEMQSALMMTALNGVLDDDGTSLATPFAQGAGHIFVSDAAASPLVMNVTKAEYEAAHPDVDNGFNVRDLNIASLGENECIGVCSWTRTVRNVSDETLTWAASFSASAGLTVAINPAGFTLAPGESQEVEVEMDVSLATDFDKWNFGTIFFDETSDAYPNAHWPVAVIPTSNNIPKTLDIITQTTSGSVEMNDLVSIGISDLQLDVIGLNKANRDDFTLIQDNNLGVGFPEVFFDSGSPTHFVQIEVPADAFSVIAEIIETTSPDLDMLLFLDTDGNGPDLADVGSLPNNSNACLSATGGSDEVCEILSPVEGVYYAAILNYQQAISGGDQVDLATAVIPNSGSDEGNMAVSGPAVVAGGTPFAINVSYDDSTMSAIDKFYGYFSMGTDPGNPGNLTNVRVSLEYLGIPDIEISPTELIASIHSETTLSETLTLTAIGGVLDWTVLTDSGNQTAQGAGLEEDHIANPNGQISASVSGLPVEICHGTGSISWLSISPSSGSLSPGQTDLAVTYDAAGLAPGIYTDSLCVSSNDPDEPVVIVPVMLTVEVQPTIFSDGFEQ